MTVADIVPIITALAALIGAIAAAFWGHGLANSKDEVIKAKDTQLETLRTNHEQVLAAKNTQILTLEREIASLRELTPAKVREYFVSMKQQLEEYIDKLKTDLQMAQCLLDQKDSEIESILLSGQEAAIELGSLKRERDELSHQKLQLEKEIESLRQNDQQMEKLRANVEVSLVRIEELRPAVEPPGISRLFFRQTCPHCGSQASSSARFCAECGRVLGGVSTSG